MVTTTFGYSQTEDRLWMSCDGWPSRVWLSRRIALQVLGSAVGVIEAPADGDARPAPERAAAEHDASLNKPQPGDAGQALKTGREAPDAKALEGAVLCTHFMLGSSGEQHELIFRTTGGERRLRLSRSGLHRWLRALHMVMERTDWLQAATPPAWLTRSYLPPALAKLLSTPPPQGLDDPVDPPDAR